MILHLEYKLEKQQLKVSNSTLFNGKKLKRSISVIPRGGTHNPDSRQNLMTRGEHRSEGKVAVNETGNTQVSLSETEGVRICENVSLAEFLKRQDN